MFQKFGERFPNINEAKVQETGTVSKVLSEATITHDTASGKTETLNLNLAPFHDFLISLQPLVGRKMKLDVETLEDILSSIVKHLGGYSQLGGGRIKIK